jgi:UDP-2,4-diacetamido-2,4,6-trideoxy-beta-L-altropyranose hydrolase
MIVFRSDFSPEIGEGHVARCASLASEFALLGYESCLIASGNLGRSYRKDFKFIEPRPWPTGIEEIVDEVSFIKSINPDLLVMDDYRLSQDYEILILENEIKWAIFKGPTQDTIWADIVINYTPSATRGDYPGVKDHNSTKFFLGAKYTLLRSEFSSPIMNRHDLTSKLRVFCCFGGGDDRGAIGRVLTALSEYSLGMVFDVVIGGSHPKADVISSIVADFPGSLVHHSPSELVGLIDHSDIAIVSGGNIAPEVISRGIPTIILAIAENQLASGRGWASRGRNCFFLGEIGQLGDSQIRDAFNILRNDLENHRLSPRSPDLELIHGRSTLARELVSFVEER